MVASHWFRKWNLLRLDNHNIGHTSNSRIISIRKRTFTCKYTVLEIFCDCEPPSKYYMPKLLTLDKEDNVMIYVCSYSHRSYIVIDPSTCGACPPSLLAKNSAPSRDTTCASKKALNPNLIFKSPPYLPMDWVRSFK